MTTGEGFGVAAIIILFGGMVLYLSEHPPATFEELQAEENARIAAQLPEGCTVHRLGEVGDVDEVIAVMCEGRNTVATNAQTTKTRLIGKVISTEYQSSTVLTFSDNIKGK